MMQSNTVQSNTEQPNVVPVPRPGFQLEQMGEEFLLYRHASKRVVYLNASAAVIWRLCDGRRTLAAIEAVLAENYPEARADMAADIRQAIETMMREGVLELAPPEAAR